MRAQDRSARKARGPLHAQADEASAKPMPPAGYTVKWSTCTHFVEGDARILNNSRVVIVADDGTVPIMRVEPLEDSEDNVRRVAVAKLRNKVLLRGEGVLRDDPRCCSAKTPARFGPRRRQRAPSRSRRRSRWCRSSSSGKSSSRKEPDGSILQWVISSDDLGDPVMNQASGKLEYQDTCFRNPKTAGHDTLGYIAPGRELAPSCLVEALTPELQRLLAYGYLPLVNFTTLIVPTANDPAYNAAPGYLRDVLGVQRQQSQLYRLGRRTERYQRDGARCGTWNYYPYDIYCHMIVSGGLEVPGAKRPATRSLPAPGVVDGKTLNVWRPVNLNINIANDWEPGAAPFEPTPVPVEEPIVVEPL